MRALPFKLDVPTAAFFLITIVSVGWVAFPLWNYSRFYSAVYNLSYSLVDISVDAHQVENVRVSIKFFVSNPTDYSGLSVISVKCGLTYVDGLHMVPIYVGPKTVNYVPSYQWVLPTEWFNVQNVSIPPFGNNTISVFFVINPNTSSLSTEELNFISFLRTMPSEVSWSVDFSLLLSSFLGGIAVSYTTSFVTPISH